MKETVSHSNTPVFAKNHSCTKPVLYQQPTEAEMCLSRRAQLKADAKDFILFVMFAICAWLLISILLTAAFGG